MFKYLFLLAASFEVNHLKVSIVPHSHDDVGWNKTPREYFDGTITDNNDDSVEKILDTVTKELTNDHTRTYH